MSLRNYKATKMRFDYDDEEIEEETEAAILEKVKNFYIFKFSSYKNTWPWPYRNPDNYAVIFAFYSNINGLF
jgi:hypothetical protein